jgi:tetratricopeptide (TPR) repeat protein
MIQKHYLTALLLFFSANLFSQYHFTWNERVQQAYETVSSLRISAGRSAISVQKKADPDNLIYDLLESYADFNQLFLNEDPEDYQQLFPQFDQRIQRLKKGPKASPFYLYSRAIAHLHRAMVLIRVDKNFQAAIDFRKAYGLLKENRNLFPAFSPNDLYFGLITTAIGTIPKSYQWIVGILGMRGTIREGNAMVLNYINGKGPLSKMFQSEALFIYPYLVMNFEGDQAKAFRFLNQAPYDFKKNHLHAYMATNLYLNHQASDKALEIATNIDASPDYFSVPFWHYEKGYAFLNQLKLENAEKEFSMFIAGFKGKFYVKDAYEKLSWIAYLRGDRKAADFYRKQLFSKGSTVTEADKLAKENAEGGIWPQPLLFKARLLSDGGFQRQAIRLLSGKTSNDFDTDTDKTEFAYRLGRIYDLMDEDSLASRYYQSAIEKGRELPAYFASRAALQLGLLCEKKGDCAGAVGYFNQCLQMQDHAFKNALDQKALSGIQRCKKRA